jgi:hypothetical protein
MGNSLVSRYATVFVLTTNGFAANIWLTHYNTINYCNPIDSWLLLYTLYSCETPQYNSILAQTRALRAFSHFQLLTYFSNRLK